MINLLKIALPVSLAFAAAVPAAAQDAAAAATTGAVNAAQFAGKSLYGPKGERIAAVYKVTSAGVPQVIINGEIRSVPASSLSVAEGKLVTSLTKKEIQKGR